MNVIFLLVILLSPVMAEESAHMGLMAGVARLAHKGDSAIGPSTLFHFDYDPDDLVGFFGEAGFSSAQKGSVNLEQKVFSGGMSFGFLPVAELSVGFATTVNEFDEGSKTKKNSEIGPLAAFHVHTDFGNWRLGTGATVIRTNSIQSFALHGMLLLTL